MIKKLLIVMTAAVCAVACMDDDASFSNTYPLDTTFEYTMPLFERGDSLFFDNQNGLGIAWGELAFYHKLSEDKSEFLGGFILSRLKGKTESDDNRFRVNSGQGMDGSSNYLVFYANSDADSMPENDVEFLAAKYGTCAMIGCFVNNTKEVVQAVQNNFVEGDRLAVRMTGYLGGQKTGAQEFVLAEKTQAKDSLVTKWSPFELGKLGIVDAIDVEIVSTRNDIPAAFCLDDMMAKVSVSY